MPLDSITINALANELREKVVGAKIDKVQQPGRDTIILTIRSGGFIGKMLISAGVGSARVHLSTENYENPQTPPMFCMLLRKHLIGAKISALRQPEMERMLIFELNTYDEMGVETKKHLIVEMMGRNSNIILTEAEGHIIDCLRRVDGDMSRVRQIQPGLLYKLPPEQEKPKFLSLTASERELILNKTDTTKLADRWLLDTFSGISPLISREICYLASGHVSKAFYEFSDEEKNKFIFEINRLDSRVRTSDYVPVMLVVDEKPADFSFMPIAQYEKSVAIVYYSDFSTLLEDFYTKRDKQELIKRKSQAMFKSIKNAYERELRKLAARCEELKKTEERELNRKKGDLITANLYRIKKGDRIAEVEDYFEENCPQIQIKLDPLKSPQQNAAFYYREYSKAKTAEKHLKELIMKGEREAAYLSSVMDEIQRAECERDLIEIRRELIDTGYLKEQKSGKREKIKESAPMRFISTSGLEIFVGKNNTQNDKLTTHTARRTDVWLHAQKIHGSHVIISTNGEKPDDKTLFEAATLAAYYSQGRESGKIPVDYTQIRYVKKPSGSMPGAVIYTDYQTILVEPDERLVEKLKSC